MSVETASRPQAVSHSPHLVVEAYWLTVSQTATHANCGRKSIYNAVARGKLRAARLGGRRELRFLATWVDQVADGEQPPRRGELDQRAYGHSF